MGWQERWIVDCGSTVQPRVLARTCLHLRLSLLAEMINF